MGRYLNPESKAFKESLNSEIYIDKSLLISHTNAVIDTKQKYICVSRPRRFGKSMALDMLSAYYSKAENTDCLFKNLKIKGDTSYHQYLNQYNVIKLNMQEFLSKSNNIQEMITLIQIRVIREFQENNIDKEHIDWAMDDIYRFTGCPFIILIDEWDCIFREYQNDSKSQKVYLDFLRMWLKDQDYVGLAYMTGILPIKKYGTHSALNMFSEYSMVDSGNLGKFFGFTEKEVKQLCQTYKMDFEELKAWYNGYYLLNTEKNYSEIAIYSPKSVVECMIRNKLGNYWNQTETYEALQIYIKMNFDGLKDAVSIMLAGGMVELDVRGFSNDMTSFGCMDDVLTLMIHLGYLAYEERERKVRIPNKEVSMEYLTAISRLENWKEVMNSIQSSKELLNALWNLDEEKVAWGIEKAHQEVSILQYNDENALSYTVNLAFYYAKEYYTLIRELPSGKGYADIVFLPRPMHIDKPAMIIELKWNKSTEGAIRQIKDKQYLKALRDYQGNLILAGINYNKKSKKHECKIEYLNYNNDVIVEGDSKEN